MKYEDNIKEILKDGPVFDLTPMEALECYRLFLARSPICNTWHSFDLSHIYLSTAINSIVLLDNIVFIIHKELFYKKLYENYILCAFPLSYLDKRYYAKEREFFIEAYREKSVILKLFSEGVTVFLSRDDIAKLTSTDKHRFSDDHIYNVKQALEYWNTVSRQTRKIFNQLTRKYTTTIKLASCVSLQEAEEIKQVTKTWFQELKGSNKAYGISLYMVYDYLVSEAPKVGYLMTQRDEDGKLWAWDYLELHGADCLLIQGHSLIPTSFKFITYSLLKFAETLGAERANIGRSVIFSGDYEAWPKTSVSDAKKYFPCEMEFTLFQLNKKNLPSTNTNTLF